MATAVHDQESGWMMLAREHAPTGHAVKERACVTSGDEHSFALNGGGVGPLDGDAMRGVLARKTECCRQASRSYLLHANETDAYERMPAVELWPKWLWQDTLHDGRVGPEIHEQPPLNYAFDDRNAH
jgi:hypothetical protein